MLLSLLIPTYNYLDGLKRILDSIPSEEIGKTIEILIFDNSTNSEVKSYVKSLSISVRYEYKAPSGNPCSNWNDLLSSASGDYSMLMHHDEYLSSKRDWYYLLNALKSNADTYLLDLYLNDGNGVVIRHSPKALRTHTILKNSSYLIRRNIIGPCACFVFKTHLLPRFNEDLIWLVDVDFYISLICKSRSIEFVDDVSIYSYQRSSGSITDSISKDVKKIRKKEHSILMKNRMNYKDNIWLGDNRLLLSLESIVWNSFRLSYKLLRKIL